MGKRCVVAGCSNDEKSGFTMHLFPKNEQLVKKWSQFVKLTRKHWTASKFSVVCSAHFSSSCYDPAHELQIQLGFKKQKNLLPNSVPSIYPETTNTDIIKSTQSQTDEEPTPKRPRTAFYKREHQRVLGEIFSLNQEENIVSPSSEPEDNNINIQIDPVEMLSMPEKVLSVACQTKKITTKKVPQRTAGTQAKPKGYDKVIQVSPKTKESSCQTDADQQQIESVKSRTEHQFDSDDEDSCLSDDNTSLYEPSSDGESSLDASFDDDERNNLEEQRKYLVFEDNLFDLYRICRKCGMNAQVSVKQRIGTFVRLYQQCDICGNCDTWDSQPFVGNIPSGNLQLSAAVLFAGTIVSKALRIFYFINMQCISMGTFFGHQRDILQPVIYRVWRRCQSNLLQSIRYSGKNIIIAGDGRADTPGHSAKFGSYTLLDLERGVVLDSQLVQSNEVKSSYHMEKEGLVRGISFLKSENLKIETIITDRHMQINKWIRENLQDVQHYFDVWHVAKGLKKKLTQIANLKDCSLIKDWIKSLVNHLYWCAASTPSGDGEIMSSKWRSVLNHVQNQHSGHDGVFTSCTHGPLTGREGQKKWFKPDTKAFDKLSEIITSRQMEKDARKISPLYQTSELEAFHSVINHFAPKMIGFSYHGMLCRTQLAALHFNENNRRAVLLEDGEVQYDIVYPKSKNGGHVVRQRRVNPTYDYVFNLMTEVMSIAGTGEHINRPECPPPLCSGINKVNKVLAFQQHRSRFGMAANDE